MCMLYAISLFEGHSKNIGGREEKLVGGVYRVSDSFQKKSEACERGMRFPL